MGKVIEASTASQYFALAMEFDWLSLSEQAELMVSKDGGFRQTQVEHPDSTHGDGSSGYGCLHEWAELFQIKSQNLP